jgi:hypothetical protein
LQPTLRTDLLTIESIAKDINKNNRKNKIDKLKKHDAVQYKNGQKSINKLYNVFFTKKVLLVNNLSVSLFHQIPSRHFSFFKQTITFF